MKKRFVKSKSIIFYLLKYKFEIVEIISALLILLFLYTAISKSFEIDKTINVIKRTPFFSEFGSFIAWTVVLVEYIIVALLLPQRTKRIGFQASFCLMLLFTGYIVFMKAFIEKLPCSCGGVISKMTWNQHLIFNVIFLLLAGLGILLSPPISKSYLNKNNSKEVAPV